MGHHHQASGNKLGFAVLLNLLISIGQLAGGLWSGSLSLLTDALHNFSDVLSLLLSWFTNRLAIKPANSIYTFGYKRAEILSAFVNALSLIVIALLLSVEAIKRFIHPVPVASQWVIYFALISIVVNVLSVGLLHNDAKHNLNMKSAYLHLLTDVMTSVAVLIGGLLMKYYDIYRIDSVLSIVIAGYLIFSGWKIIKHSIRILMQAVPEQVDLNQLTAQIAKLNAVKSIEKIYLWQLNENEWYLYLSLLIETDKKHIIKNQIQKMLPKQAHVFIETI